MKEIIVKLGAGHVYPKDITDIDADTMIIHVDRCYSKGHHQTISEVENVAVKFLKSQDIQSMVTFVGCDIFEFMDNFKYRVNHIEAYRIFEHMEYLSGEVGRLLEACNMLTVEDGTLDIIVPNSISIAEMILKYEKSASNMNHAERLNYKLIINSENQNGKFDPHASTWTPRLAREYIESEATWVIDWIKDSIMYENRDIYMEIFCSKGRQTNG
jgi:hypothetical protein